MTADLRAELIADLHAFADLLARRPDMPIGEWTRAGVQYTVFGDDDAVKVAEVDRIASRLGVDVDRDETHATARLQCGRVEYVVHAITDQGSAQWQAAVSYVGAVEPEMVTR